MTAPAYLFLKCGAFGLRTLARLYGQIISRPDATWRIPSRDVDRTIKAHVYQPKSRRKDISLPVLINFHGSGFVIPAHGSDDDFCRQVSQQTGYSVLDIQYRLAPEHPFPAALEDVEDVVNWVRTQPKKFNLQRIAMSGFSAGGNLALAASSTLFPPGTFRSVISFYPSVECFLDPDNLVAPESGGKPLPPFAIRLFKQCYLQSKVDARDPRVSPALADPNRFPTNVLIISAGYDSLAPEAERLAQNLQKHSTRYVVHKRMERCDHGWDKLAKKGGRGWELKEKAYASAISMLLR
ncbi:hypothetical protein ABOM_001618 [Aspergillus bombycis]|uniref:Alpha/beta hydrolase fold-3 domain-containing protein n=1 Tax=Aspergillus bombycis TaxID=109264 RepID=A0A1F8AD20_9EURO|nr:hypothetical protein ABOM_001618 [Aspergillus bombycis]OGM49603.1 hypothetical protein ABOM_001618 [Aspergillus bombycis]